MNILFICEDNAFLSIIAESILKSVTGARFGSFSAGVRPAKEVNKQVLRFLREHHISVGGLRPKSLADFRELRGFRMDFVITLCDMNGAHIADWPGAPFIAHWNIEEDDDLACRFAPSEEVIRDTFWTLMRRINILASLPQDKLNLRRLQQRALTLQPNYL